MLCSRLRLRGVSALRYHHGVRPSARASASRLPPKRVFGSSPKPQDVKTSRGDVSLVMGFAAGGFAGVVSALSGVGGGMVLIPAVAKMTTMPMQTVNGTCLGGLTAGATAGAWNYSQADSCNYPLALLTSIPAIVFARAGVKAAHSFSSKTLSSIVGFGMLASVPLIVLKNSEFMANLRSKSDNGDDDSSNPLDLQYHSSNALVAHGNTTPLTDMIAQDPLAFAAANARYVVVGALAGFISGLCGIGGSMFTTTYLTAGTDMPQSIVVGTTLVSVLPMAMSANYFNYKNKSIHFPTALKVGSSLVVATYFTSKYILQYKVPEDILRAVLATTISAAAIAMIRRPI
uniref:Membrane transporter protein n=1 Tax=Globisporangium ultimum (strain ATCC 200006 / CBS 805.95 / DAOM BR144) TaxID=431595 RepID=K3W9D2_GLOUD